MSASDQFPISVYLTCKDIHRQLAFYREKLGFEMNVCWPDEKNPMFAELNLGGQGILLGAHSSIEDAEKWCGDDKEMKAYYAEQAGEFEGNAAGVGIVTYLMVDDVDAYHAGLVKKGVTGMLAPRTQFYGQRDFPVRDPEGYRLTFYTPVKMESCQSCGMPLPDAKPGQMYCQYCTDEKGNLRPYGAVLEGTITGFFMGMQKMDRASAEVAAKEHLAKMPAWTARKVD